MQIYVVYDSYGPVCAFTELPDAEQHADRLNSQRGRGARMYLVLPMKLNYGQIL